MNEFSQDQPPAALPGEGPPPASPSRNAIFLAVAVALTAAACAVVFFRPFPLGVPGEWVWKLVADPDWEAIGPFLRVSACFVVLVGLSAWAIRRLGRLGEGAVLAGLVLYLFLLHFVLGVASPGGLREPFLAASAPGASNVYHEQALKIKNVRSFLKNYRVIAKQSSGWQLRTHPPGPTLFFWAAHRLYQAAPQWLAEAVIAVPESHCPPTESVQEIRFMLDYTDRQKAAIWTAIFVLWLAAASTIVPVYLWARMLYGRTIALCAAAMTGVIPSLMLFNPLIDQLYPPLLAWIGYLAWVAIRRRSMLAAGAAGLLVCVGMFFTLAFVSAVALVYLILFSQMVDRIDDRVPPNRQWSQYALLAAGVAAVLLPVSLIAVSALPSELRPGLRLLLALAVAAVIIETAAILAAMKIRDEAGLKQQASDFSPLIGSGLVGLLLGAVAIGCLGHDVLGSWKHSFLMNSRFNLEAGRHYVPWLLANPLCFIAYLGLPAACLFVRRLGYYPCHITAAVLVLLLLLWGSGQNLGEVERLWMPLMPLCVMAGAAALRAFRRFALPAALLLLALQLAQVAFFKMVIQTVRLAG